MIFEPLTQPIPAFLSGSNITFVVVFNSYAGAGRECASTFQRNRIVKTPRRLLRGCR